MARRSLPIAVVGSWLLVACAGWEGGRGNTDGAAGSAEGGAGSSSPASLSCETRPHASPAPLKLLARGEYERTLRAILGDDAVNVAGPDFSQLADPKPLHAFRSMAVGTTGSDVEARFRIADVIAQAVGKGPRALSTIAPCIGVEQHPSDACVEELISSVGQRLFRRPLDAPEHTWLRGLYDEAETIAQGDGPRFVLFALLESPHFEYRLETRGTPRTDDPHALDLSAYELASRLSFLLWGSAPDASLQKAAAEGRLASEAGLKTETDRLLADPRAQAQLSRFYEQWLETEELPLVNQSATFLGGIGRVGLSDAMKTELSGLLRSITFDDAGKFEDLYTSPLAVVTSPDLAKLYQIDPFVSGSRTTVDGKTRAGLLTRSALLLTSGETTSPIRRGAFVRRKLMCDPIPSPDPNAFPAGTIQPPSFDANATSRQRWTAKTSEGRCIVCHGTFNSLGFALENYDTIGRYRSDEPIVDPATGAEIKRLPIDAGVDVELDGLRLHVSGAVGLGRALADSRRAKDCLATQWLRFATGRLEEDSDGCVLRDVADAMARGTPLLQALEKIVLSPEFRVRGSASP